MPETAIRSVTSTECFTGPADRPRQVVRVTVDRRLAEPGTVTVTGRGVTGEARLPAGEGEVTVEAAVGTGDHPVGTRIPVEVCVRPGGERATGELVVAEPGWTMYMIPHFHYDPVWWNTQAAYTVTWELQGNDGTTRPVWERNGFNLVRAHLEMAAADPDYTFVLAEVDYLKPFWDVHPEHRATLRQLIAAGRVEIVGGTYNEPNTNLTGSETTIRNLVHGVGYQRDIMGADPRTAWQLDVFGHDPQFPGLVAEAGLTSSSWARGPFHQWGPILTTWNGVGGDAGVMQFPAEFEWLSPSGRGVLTHYMPNHYSAGWWMDSSATLAEAEEKVYDLFLAVKPAAATRNTLLPVGTDYTPPNKWVTEIHRDWNSRYLWPRFVCGLPRDFFAAVRAELDARGVAPTPISRDMNPVYTGKDVSYIDTKQAQRAAETAATDAEKLAAFADLLGAGRYPHATMDKVWRQLAYGAHHDAITGSESDQVYIDLVTGWREAHDLAAEVRDTALTALLDRVDTTGDGHALVVTNTLAFHRTDLVRVTVPRRAATGGVRLCDDTGAEVPCVVEAGDDTCLTLAFVARDVPPTGWRTWRLTWEDDAAPAHWERQSDGAARIAGDHFEITADPARGGALSAVRDLVTGRDLLRPGALGNELWVYDEYPAHPQFGEGPWHLLPTGRVVTSGATAAESVHVEHSPAGRRLVVTGTVGEVRYEQRVTLWHGLDRAEFRTRVLDFTGADRLLRVRFGCDVPGARPVSEVAGAVVARGFALTEEDTAEAPWTLDNPANTFFALGSTAHLRLRSPQGAPLGDAALAVAEIVVAEPEHAARDARDLVVALARAGVTATTSTARGARYGHLRTDSNLPDIRVVLGGPDTNPLAREVLAAAGARHTEEFDRALAAHGSVRLLVPGRTSVEDAWVAGADLRDVTALPTLLVAGRDPERLAAEIAALAAEFTSGSAADAVTADPGPLTRWDGHTVGLLSRGLPGFAVGPAGDLQLSLLRSCTGWPSGVWLDPPLRRAPDGSSFQLQHWTHDFDYALVSGAGDWRAAQLVARGAEFTTPLLARTVAAHPGPLPATHSLLRVTPERQVHVQAVKAAGNPYATGASTVGRAADGVTVRLVETTGRPVRATVSTPFGWRDAHRTDLLEQRRTGSVLDGRDITLPLDGAEIATVVAVPAGAAQAGTGSGTEAGTGADRPLGREHETAQPVYARYWLHNRGPAPAGFLPVSITADPVVHHVGAGTALTASVTVASHHTDAAVESTVRVTVPAGWSADPGARPLRLAPGGHTRFPLTVTAPPDAAPGLHFGRVSVAVGEDTVEDVLTLLVPGGPADEVVPPPPGPERDHGEQTQGTRAATARPLGLDLAVVTEEVTVAPGGRARLTVRATSHAADAVDGEAMVVSPWGTWEAIRPYTTGFHLAPGAATDITFEVAPPVDAEPGHWWAMVKLMWFGRVHYSAAVPVRVGHR
ncbi:glycoside hydrolase family 38 N-terminal domain-containing protein [Streptantibioticus cattleyicolor]|uniref:Glycoside hydrolase family 38 n=1 Tax=Streptantibioticus cattleyicolor (strain ATCC 35852 / DSM 46488 / JCM 4925 / NBRC 14057 / NRRL 8057) TaxID=1003195 RepID=G8XHP4_STREN|nr:NEW3 domain-containing protein [Streptantibioticus cattleyicolor]AEW98909.1 glycoside hydrolase family 38 [Streptantibioticus cattleyicolor NRRL 8057 = DSM 46488]